MGMLGKDFLPCSIIANLKVIRYFTTGSPHFTTLPYAELLDIKVLLILLTRNFTYPQQNTRLGSWKLQQMHGTPGH